MYVGGYKNKKIQDFINTLHFPYNQYDISYCSVMYLHLLPCGNAIHTKSLTLLRIQLPQTLHCHAHSFSLSRLWEFLCKHFLFQRFLTLHKLERL